MRRVQMCVALVLSVILPASMVFGADSKDGISGKIYYHWAYDAEPASAGFNEFSISRLYFNYGKPLSESMRFDLTTDIYHDGHAWVGIQKFAFLTADIGMGKVFIGLQSMNMFNVIASNWGYRFLAKSSMNKHKFADPADMGIGYALTVAEKVQLHLTVTNGGGYKKVEHDKYKKLAAQAVMGEKSLAKHPGFNAGAAVSYEPYDLGTGATASLSVITLFGAFATETLRVGGEIDREIDSGASSRAVMAAYFDYHVSAVHKMHVQLFGRVELYDPDTAVPGDEFGIIAGINISPIKAVHIAPNIRMGKLASGDFGFSAAYLNFEFKY